MKRLGSLFGLLAGLCVMASPVLAQTTASYTKTPECLISGVITLPTAADPLTGWQKPGRANIDLSAILYKTATGVSSNYVTLKYSDTNGLTGAANWVRSYTQTPAQGEALTHLNFVAGGLLKTLYDVWTLDVSQQADLTYYAVLDVWDGFHKNHWLHVEGNLTGGTVQIPGPGGGPPVSRLTPVSAILTDPGVFANYGDASTTIMIRQLPMGGFISVHILKDNSVPIFEDDEMVDITSDSKGTHATGVYNAHTYRVDISADGKTADWGFNGEPLHTLSTPKAP